MKIYTTRARQADLVYLAPLLREEDKAEIQAVSGLNHEQALALPQALEGECYVMRLGSPKAPPFLVFGCSHSGVIWMVSTPDIRRAGIAVTRAAKAWFKKWLTQHPLLTNIVDTRNTMHVRWLASLGATFFETVEIRGVPFRRFVIQGESNVLLRSNRRSRGRDLHRVRSGEQCQCKPARGRKPKERSRCAG